MPGQPFDLVFAATFVERVQRLPNEVKKLVERKVSAFAMNPDLRGANSETLGGRARDNGWHSFRIDRNCRVIYGVTGRTAHLHWVDHHDDAYRRAERNKFASHPMTGAAQVFEVPPPAGAQWPRTPFRSGEPSAAASHGPAASEGSVADTPSRSEDSTAVQGDGNIPSTLPEAPPFANEPDDYLVALGVPEDWVPTVKSLRARDDLSDLIGKIPDEA